MIDPPPLTHPPHCIYNTSRFTYLLQAEAVRTGAVEKEVGKISVGRLQVSNTQTRDGDRNICQVDCQGKQVDEHDNPEDGATNTLTVEEGVEHQVKNQRINTVEQSLMKDIKIEDSIEELQYIIICC